MVYIFEDYTILLVWIFWKLWLNLLRVTLKGKNSVQSSKTVSCFKSYTNLYFKKMTKTVLVLKEIPHNALSKTDRNKITQFWWLTGKCFLNISF